MPSPTLPPAKSIVLFRRDLRLCDNYALYNANSQGNILPVYIHDNAKSNQTWPIGGASQWWLHHSLKQLDTEFTKQSHRLHIFSTKHSNSTGDILVKLCQDNQCNTIYWNRRYEPEHIHHDTALKSFLLENNIHVESFNNNLLSEPWQQVNKQGTPYKVFTPYWRYCKNRFHTESNVPEPLRAPQLNTPEKPWKTDDQITLDDLNLLPKNPNWANDFDTHWQAGEIAAQDAWQDFLNNSINRYEDARNIPSVAGTSKLSPHLAFGEISVRQIWHDVQQHLTLETKNSQDLDRYLSEIGWREFSYYQLYHFPKLPEKNFNAKFDHFSWKQPNDTLIAWQKGLTGYPLVDAGMRELWQTGYMHNRVRMVVASFLCKDLLIHWQEGAKWFWDTLLDADLASNSASWQWCAGCGADAAPFFRIFNPTTQSEKFDPEGLYIKKWVPELSNMPKKYLHKPAEAPIEILKQANVILGTTYPRPIVDHKSARLEALERYKQLKEINR